MNTDAQEGGHQAFFTFISSEARTVLGRLSMSLRGMGLSRASSPHERMEVASGLVSLVKSALGSWNSSD